MASGVPVVVYPVPGPSDVVIQNRTGVLHEHCRGRPWGHSSSAARGIAHARRYSWRRSAEAFAILIEPDGTIGQVRALRVD